MRLYAASMMLGCEDSELEDGHTPLYTNKLRGRWVVIVLFVVWLCYVGLAFLFVDQLKFFRRDSIRRTNVGSVRQLDCTACCD